MSSIGERIKEARENLGLSQPELAERLGMEPKKGRSTINNWELGANKVKDDALKALSERLNVSADYLLGLSDVKTLDTNIQSVCSLTGLSEQSVMLLMRKSERNKDIDKIIQALCGEEE